MFTAPATPAPSADALRFVRCEKSLDRAQAQHAMTLAKLPTKERHARELANPAIAEHARETVAAWAFRVIELGGTVEAKPEEKPACCAHCGAVVKAPKPRPVRSERVQAMRRFYAVAASHNLSTRDAQAMTAALSKYLGVVIPSRASLSAGHWREAVAGLEFGLITWA
jgi:hypothetical protein